MCYTYKRGEREGRREKREEKREFKGKVLKESPPSRRGEMSP